MLPETAAAQNVLRLLERRWRHRLPDGELPRALKKVLVKMPHFIEWRDHYAQHDALPFRDLDFHPEVVWRPDGEPVDLLLDELESDPADYFCVDCGDEVTRGRGRCDPCAHWRVHGIGH